LIKGLLEDSEDAHRQELLDLQLCLEEFEALEKPTIAKLKGFCIGGGLMLALCCDFRIASQRTIFSFPEVKIGLPILMGTQRLTRVTGVGAAKEIILLGKRFSAKDALAYGLLHKVVLPDQLDNAVAELAEKFFHLPSITIGLAKGLINKSYDLTLRESQDLELDTLDELLKSSDLQEAINSYRNENKLKFTGE
jgi:enoyl-CoA hydratase/carnithine racemase